ncbi:MAG: transcription-repair coupling factor, partial [Campylobacterales bacterium]|nr:transcription-repair coupling factor [Campylobacterales bacterium]
SYYQYNKKKLLIAPLSTAVKFLPKKELFDTQNIEFGDTVDLNETKEKLLCWGYSFVDIVEQKGECSFRGDIIDVFSPLSKKPVRISLFDDEVESIREFETQTQKSLKEELEKVEIKPALFGLSSEAHEKLKLKTEISGSDSFFKDIHSLGFWFLNQLDLAVDITTDLKSFFTQDLTSEIHDLYSFNKEGFIPKESFENIEELPQPKVFKELHTEDPKAILEVHKSKKLTVIAKSDTLLKQYEIEKEDVNFIESLAIVNLISNNEVVISLNKPVKKQRKKAAKIVLDELKVGDYIVHENYGVGVFLGLEQVSILGGIRDFVGLKYANDDKLLIPVENIHIIDRYVGQSGVLPTVDKLGKSSFARLKNTVKEKLYEIAGEIIQRAAARELIKAVKIEEPVEMAEFQHGAGFLYTPDQKRSINEILEDLAAGKVMDRLLSGDVGFGKTEVAMNAIFAAAKAGYQTAMVVPTTLLSSQHHHSIEKRFKEYGIAVHRFDRFTTAKEKKIIKDGLKNGDIKVVVGTHGLIGVDFDNLGLMVVDEEHKFGVKQKEKLKDKAKNLHLLSMSATPIPRSLNMALSKIKGFSQILTPPEEREDVRTHVKENEEALVKEAISREIRRGGQIFYVFNRISGIEQKKKQLQDMMPNLKILVLHSKIKAEISEKELLAFEEGEYDMLLSTTIIESGIHIPNVNTILIDGADRFGIADLHQLRGRVGRSKRQGYCYFLVGDKDELTDDSKKRLAAMESNSFLGSGSVLAYHDLEIRGGGNIIGAEQSGQIKNIGYSLYLKMLEDAINELSGEAVSEEEEKKVEIKLAVKAYLSSELIEEDRVRIELYRRFSNAIEPAQVYELQEEIEDRFGKLDDVTKQFCDIIVIKILSLRKDIKVISNFQQNISIQYNDDRKEVIKSPSKDDDDIIATTLKFVKK